MHAAEYPDLLPLRETPELIEGLHAAGLLAAEEGRVLHEAVECLQGQSLRCHLGNRKRIVPESDALSLVRNGGIAVLQRHGMAFS
jgi:hypothetical protein